MNVMIIGGSGKWSSEFYIPFLTHYNELKIACIVDYINPNTSEYTSKYSVLWGKNNTTWLKLENDNELNKSRINHAIEFLNIDFVIISTPPCHHYYYTCLCLESGLDCIYDKPLIANVAQTSNMKQAKNIISKYNQLMKKIKLSKHKNFNRPCMVYLPLRRRIQGDYVEMREHISDIYSYTHQHCNYFYLSHNDGVHRTTREMEMDFAHGYNKGLGKCTHTGYHIIDFLAFILEKAGLKNSTCECSLIYKTNVDDYLKSNTFQNTKKVLKLNDKSIPISDIAKRADLDVCIKLTLRNGQTICNGIINLMHTGMSNRIDKSYTQSHPEDTGRTNQLIFEAHMGAMGRISLSVDTSAGTQGKIGIFNISYNDHPLIKDKLKKEKQYNKSKCILNDTLSDIIHSCITDNPIQNELNIEKQYNTINLYSAIQQLLCGKAKVTFKFK